MSLPRLEKPSSAAPSAAVVLSATGRSSGADRPFDESSDGARRLIEKLASSGQLKIGFLIRMLQEGRAELFEIGLAKMLGLDFGRLERLFYGSGAKPLAMACHAAGIDRCVFPTVYRLSRKHRRLDGDLRDDDRADAEAVFRSYRRPEAIAWLHAC